MGALGTHVSSMHYENLWKNAAIQYRLCFSDSDPLGMKVWASRPGEEPPRAEVLAEGTGNRHGWREELYPARAVPCALCQRETWGLCAEWQEQRPKDTAVGRSQRELGWLPGACGFPRTWAFSPREAAALQDCGNCRDQLGGLYSNPRGG